MCGFFGCAFLSRLFCQLFPERRGCRRRRRRGVESGGGDERQKYGENELAMIFTRIAQRQSSLNNVNGEDDVVKCRTILGSQP